jgi:hypothetical protein
MVAYRAVRSQKQISKSVYIFVYRRNIKGKVHRRSGSIFVVLRYAMDLFLNLRYRVLIVIDGLKPVS